MDYKPGSDPFFILQDEFRKIIHNPDKDYLLFGFSHVRVFDTTGNVVLRAGEAASRINLSMAEVFARKGFVVPLYMASSPVTPPAMMNLARRHDFLKRFGKRMETESVRENLMRWNEIVPDRHAGLVERLQLAYAVTEHDVAGVRISAAQAYVDMMYRM